MSTTTAHTTQRSTLWLLASLYVSQSLGVGFFFVALAGVLRERGAPLEVIGLISALGLVRACKFLWARWSTATAPHDTATTAAGYWSCSP